jgi:hypothetical protein
MRVVWLTQEEFDKMDEYSCSVPTGTTLGKRWKCKRDYFDASKGWLMGEYTAIVPDSRGNRFSDRVLIQWSEISIRVELTPFGQHFDEWIRETDVELCGEGRCHYLYDGGGKVIE